MTSKPQSADRDIAPFDIVSAHDVHAGEIEALYDQVFGPGRYAKTAERLREGNTRIEAACHAATDDHGLVGSVQFRPLAVGAAGRAVLLGPLAISQRRRGDGIAFKLMETGIAACAARGWPAVILVGDEPYYTRAGFARAARDRFVMPGPVAADRILVRELSAEGASISGTLSAPRATMQAS